MLGFLDALCAALLARNSIEIYRLLALPQAKKLPRLVREESLGIAKAGPLTNRAPLQALQHYYKLTHLVDESADEDCDSEGEKPQMEFSFRKAG